MVSSVVASAITGIAAMLSAMIAIGAYITLNGGTPNWDGESLRASFQYEEQVVNAIVDIAGQRLRFEIELEDGKRKMNLQSTNGLNWTYFVLANETVDNVSYVFVSECMVLSEDASGYLPMPSTFFPEEGDMPEVASLRNGTVLQVETEEMVVTFDLNYGLFSKGEISTYENYSSEMDLIGFDLSSLDPDAFRLPDVCNGDDPSNSAIKEAFEMAVERSMTTSMNEAGTNLSAMQDGDERRLGYNPINHVPYTNYCGAGVEGVINGEGRAPRNHIDRCCAFHDFECGSDVASLGGWQGASGSARSWVPGQHGGRAEHCSCAGALHQCARVAFWHAVATGDWQALTASAQVFWAYYSMPCWFEWRICFPYICGITWHGRWWFRWPRIRWCKWCRRIPLPTVAFVSGYHRRQWCTNNDVVYWRQSQRDSNCHVAR